MSEKQFAHDGKYHYRDNFLVDFNAFAFFSAKPLFYLWKDGFVVNWNSMKLCDGRVELENTLKNYFEVF